MTIHGGCWSDIGHRELNEDGVLYRQTSKNGQSFALCAVFDGVGGMEHGEVASIWLAERAKDWYSEVSEWIDIETVEADLIFAHLKDAVETWNNVVFRIRQNDGIQTGSTMSVLVLLRDRYMGVQVGDSRIYCVRNGEMLQLTLDDTVKREINGKIKGVLTNFIGKTDELTYQNLEGICRPGDLYFVCSDGFYHHLEPDDMGYAVEHCAAGQPCEEICHFQVEQMIARGERDNTSVAMAYIPCEAGKTEKTVGSEESEETVIE